jgi:hypothetical protein
MRKILAISLAVAALSTPAAAQEPGDWVLSRWRGSSQYFPGVVQSRHGNLVNIRFDDGTSEAVPADQVRPYNWRVGSAIECRWTDGNWYDATIIAMSGDAGLTVRYEDGVVQETSTGACRST